MKHTLYRCKACGTYQKKKENKKWIKVFCLQTNTDTTLIRVNNKPKKDAQ